MAHHDGGGGDLVVAAAPALADVGALGLLAHGGQLEPAQLALDLHVLLPLRHHALQPVRLAQVLLLLRLRVSSAAVPQYYCLSGVQFIHTPLLVLYVLLSCMHRFRTVESLESAVGFF